MQVLMSAARLRYVQAGMALDITARIMTNRCHPARTKLAAMALGLVEVRPPWLIPGPAKTPRLARTSIWVFDHGRRRFVRAREAPVLVQEIGSPKSRGPRVYSPSLLRFLPPTPPPAA